MMPQSSHRLVTATIASPIGDLLLIADGNGRLRMAEFADCAERIDRWLRRRFGCVREELLEQEIASGITDGFARYFGGDVAALDSVPVLLDGTAFQNELWGALRKIRPGETVGYGAMAERLGRPRAARAVGHANGTNPLSIVVPCHRLVGAGGDLTNDGGGIERKRWLIDHEARHAARRRSPAGQS